MIVPAAKLRYIDRPAYGPFAAPYIAIDLNGARAADVEVLSDLPCPVLGIGDSAGAAARLCDVVVNAPMHLASVIANIEAAPMTAMTLVQTLRATERLEVPAALIVESLAYAALQGGAENRAWLAARAEPEITAPGSEKPLWVERSEGALTLTLNRPQARNAIDVALRDALCEALSLAAIDRTIGEIHVRGNGKCFSTGGALAEFGTVSDQATAHLHGACIGAGAELAALCGQVVAQRSTFFQLPEIRFGLIPGSGGTVGVARRIGRQRAALMMLSAARVGFATALEWGLVDGEESASF